MNQSLSLLSVYESRFSRQNFHSKTTLFLILNSFISIIANNNDDNGI